MKRIVLFVAFFALIIALPLHVMAAETDAKLFCDGREVVADVPPQIIDDRMMVPLRAIFEALNATVQWDSVTSTVTSVRGGTTVRLTIGDPHVYVNGVAKALPVAAQIVQGRTMVPSRAIADAFGVFANWDNTARASVFWSDQDQARYTYVYDWTGRPFLIDSVLEHTYVSRGYTTTRPSSRKTELNAEQVYAKCSSAVFFLEIYDRLGQNIATGSGFFLDKEGTAVTNYHVIDDAYSAKVVLPDSTKKYDVLGVYSYSEQEDWAILKVNGSDFDYLPIGDSGTAVGGATVFALGSPLGLQNTISQGLVSNPNRIEDGMSYIQISAPISSGSSGGALLNKYGEVIGITSASYVKGQNLNLAIPMTYVPMNNIKPLSSVYSVTGAEIDAYTSLARFLLEKGEKYETGYYLDSPYYTEYHMVYYTDSEYIMFYRLFNTYSRCHFYNLYFYPDGSVKYKYCQYTEKYDNSLDKMIEYLECTIDPATYTRYTSMKYGEYDYLPAYVTYNKNALLENAGGWISSILDRSQGILSYYGSGMTLKDIGFTSFE